MTRFVQGLFSLALLVAALLSVLPSSGWAQVEWVCGESDPNDPNFAEWLRSFYAAHAQPILGSEQRLANGVAWRLVVDGATRLAVPRITWMPDKKAMEKANRMFDLIQGCEMVTYYEMAGLYYGLSKQNDSIRPTSGFIVQSKEVVTLSYATPNLVSAFEVLVEQTDGMRIPMLIGRVLDLREGKIVSVQPCGPGPETELWTLASQFRFGNFLEVCDTDSSAKFVALWQSKINTATRAQLSRRDAGVRYCREFLDEDPASNRWFTLYLTHAGLAVYTVSVWPYSWRECVLYKSPFNPVIIPYRELEPFMKPGPWRDELLAGR